MYILKRSGLNTDPWGKLCLTVSQFELKLCVLKDFNFQYYSLFYIYSVRYKPVWGFIMDIILVTFQCVQQKFMIYIVKCSCQITKNAGYIHFLIPCIEDGISLKESLSVDIPHCNPHFWGTSIWQSWKWWSSLQNISISNNLEKPSGKISL
jgi:hypothetical protein